MLTKKDLASIQEMLKSTKKEIVDEVTEKVVTKVEVFIQKNTDNLVELITTGFNMQDSNLSEINASLNNHEGRILQLEKKVFHSN